MKSILAGSMYAIKKKWVLHVIMYAWHLLLAVWPLYIFRGILIREIGSSAALDPLVADFDFMLFADFMRFHSQAFKNLFPWVLGFVFLSVLGNTFLIGGVIDQLAQPNLAFKWKRFMAISARLFVKNLLILLISLFLFLCLLLFSALIFFFLSLLAQGSSERAYFFWFLPGFLVLGVGLYVVHSLKIVLRVSLNARPYLFVNEIFASSLRFVCKKFFRTLFLLFPLVASFFLYLLYYFTVGSKSIETLAIIIFVQQIVSFLSVFFRNWAYAIGIHLE